MKRKRAPVSYRELSTDDSSSDDSRGDVEVVKNIVVPQRRSDRAPNRASHRASNRAPHRAFNRSPSRPQVSSRSRRNRIVSYKELSSDEDMDEDFEEEEGSPPQRVKRQKMTPSASQTRVPRGRQRGRPTRSRGPVKPVSAKSSPKPKSQSIASDGHIPPWASLPYHVLLQIFVYASHPLHDENLVQTPSVPWLLSMARMCVNFSKPALTALYRNPPIYAPEKSRRTKLLQLLLEPRAGHKEDYNVMVKRLELDATKIAALTAPGPGDIELGALVKALVTLREIDIFDPLDRPPYRKRTKPLRWRYPDELFEALRQGGLHLKSWRWNSSLCSKGPLWMKEVHEDRSFQSLEEIFLTNYSHLAKRECNDGPTPEELLASALAVLPRLRSLTFESSSFVNQDLLPLLPNNLVNLGIVNCDSLTSEVLQAFLITHGSRLEELILNHNQALGISFLPDLKRSCPRLETLRIDLNYYNTLSTHYDSEKYVDLLEEEEIPSWPSTLRTLEMAYLRKWTLGAAKTFFGSLIDSADELPELRELVIKAIININWRERAAFRDEWIGRFQRVFLRKCAPPNPHLASLRAFREWKESQVLGSGPTGSSMDLCTKAHTIYSNENLTAGPSRNEGLSSRSDENEDSDVLIANRRNLQRQSRVTASDDTENTESAEIWGKRRLRSRRKASEGSSEEASDDETDDWKEESVDERFVQGKCRVVDIRIDNLRPREELFNENDFLDSEVSGDEDWDGNDDIENDGYAW